MFVGLYVGSLGGVCVVSKYKVVVIGLIVGDMEVIPDGVMDGVMDGVLEGYLMGY